MSVTVVRDKEATVVTIKADSRSMFPPLCQVLGALCYSPVCCSAHKGLMIPCLTAVLGTIQIMLGLFNIALGPGRPAFHPMDMAELGASYWLGAVYIVVGIMSILAGQFPSLCLVGFTVSMNIVGGLFAVTGIMMFSAEIQSATFAVFTWNLYGYDSKSRRSLISMDAVTVITAVLQVLMCITFAAMGIKALVNKKKKDKQVAEEVEDQKPELKEILMSSPCA